MTNKRVWLREYHFRKTILSMTADGTKITYRSVSARIKKLFDIAPDDRTLAKYMKSLNKGSPAIFAIEEQIERLTEQLADLKSQLACKKQ